MIQLLSTGSELKEKTIIACCLLISKLLNIHIDKTTHIMFTDVENETL